MVEPPVVTSGALLDGTLLTREETGRGIHLLTFMVDGGCAVPAPGQFYQVRCGSGREHLLRRPLSAHGAEAGAKGLALSFLVEAVGWGTRWLGSLEVGREVSLLGPLGKGFDWSGASRALLVAGGIGLAPLVYLAKELEKGGVHYDFIAGFKTGESYYAPLEGLGGFAAAYTEDGSVGTCGQVCDGLPEYLGRGCDSVFTCGPEAMMYVVAAQSEEAGLRCQVSLDSRMACGIGTCRGCVKPGAGGRNLCVCTEGPVFESREVLWRPQGAGGASGKKDGNKTAPGNGAGTDRGR